MNANFEEVGAAGATGAGLFALVRWVIEWSFKRTERVESSRKAEESAKLDHLLVEVQAMRADFMAHGTTLKVIEERFLSFEREHAALGTRIDKGLKDHSTRVGILEAWMNQEKGRRWWIR